MIEKYFFQEDKALDKLDDEQFPGMFFARAKIYDRNTNTNENLRINDLFKSKENYIRYVLQIHLYMGRDMPPADETGAADPFVIAKCMGKTAKSKTKFETLNPGFFETIQMEVSLPPKDNPNVRNKF